MTVGMEELWRYGKLWRRFFIIAFVRETEYRINFLISAGEQMAQVAVAVLTVLILYRFTGRVAGWSQAQVLLLVGIYRVVEGVINMQIAPNMMAMSGYIRHGDMDFLLLRPVSSQFLVSTRTLELSESVNVAIGLGLAVYAGHLAGIGWSVAGCVVAALYALCGVVLLYALWFFTVTWTFWLVQVDTLDTLFYSMFEAARYPVDFFKGAFRALLTFVIPVAFATTFPVEALQGSVQWSMLIGGIVLSVGALLGTHLFWRYALRHYSSASS